MIDANSINNYCNNYFHPENFWDETTLGKVEAAGIVCSWATGVVPIIMYVGLKVSDCMKGDDQDNPHELGVFQFDQLNLKLDVFRNETLMNTKSINQNEDEGMSKPELNESLFALESKISEFNNTLFNLKKEERNQVNQIYDNASGSLHNFILLDRQGMHKFKNAPFDQIRKIWVDRSWICPYALDKTSDECEKVDNQVLKFHDRLIYEACNYYKNNSENRITEDGQPSIELIKLFKEIEKNFDKIVIPKIPPIDFRIKWTELQNVDPNFSEAQFNQLMSDALSQL